MGGGKGGGGDGKDGTQHCVDRGDRARSRASIWSAAAAMTAGSTTPVTQSPPSPVTRAAAMQPSAATEAAERLQSAMAGPR